MILSVRLIVLFFIGLQCLSCGNNTESLPPEVYNEVVNSGIIGIVTDNEGQILDDVTVRMEDQERITASDGSFTFGIQSVPSTGFTLRFSKEGYFTCTKKVKSEKGITYSSVVLVPLNPTDNITATEYDSVEKNRCILYFEKNTIVKSSGEIFLGIVTCYLDIISGLNAGFHFSANGNGFVDDPTESGYQKDIFTTIGHFRVKLADESGNELRIGKGRNLTVKAAIPQQLISSAPKDCPLWFYDEAKACWKKYGNAQTDETGTYYTALLDKVGSWMIAYDDKVGYVQGMVNCAMKPNAGLLVNAGQSVGITDNDGRYKIHVPVGRQIITVVERVFNGGLTAPARSLKITAEQETVEMNMTLELCGAEISGKVVDCSENSMSGMIIMRGVNGYFTTRAILQNGTFRITVPPNIPLTLNIRGINGYSSIERNIEPLEKSISKDLGNIKVCVP